MATCLHVVLPQWTGNERLSTHLRHEMMECAILCDLEPHQGPVPTGRLSDPGASDSLDRDPVRWLDRDLAEFRWFDAET